MVNETFDPIKELQAVREKRDMQRRKKYRRSKLERFRAELVSMRRAGASCQDLVIWLQMKHRVKIHRSNIDRYLASLPEMVPGTLIAPSIVISNSEEN
jgi:hypothetical protein